MRKVEALIVSTGLLMLSSCTNKIDALERTTRSDMADLRSLQAEHGSQLSQLRQELETLRGQVEEIQFSSQGRTREIEQTLQRLNTRMPPPSGVPEDLLSRDEERISRINSPAAEKFKAALTQLRTGDLQGASQSFSAFVAENPGTAFTDNGLFWQGIAHSKLGQYDRAIVSFTEVFRSYPAEDMVAPALFYLADSFEKTGGREDAQLTLQKLVEEHPSSPYAAQARPLLKAAPRRGR